MEVDGVLVHYSKEGDITRHPPSNVGLVAIADIMHNHAAGMLEATGASAKKDNFKKKSI